MCNPEFMFLKGKKCEVIQYMVVMTWWHGQAVNEKWIWTLIEYNTVRTSKEIIIKFNTRQPNDHPFHLETDYGMMLLVGNSAIN